MINPANILSGVDFGTPDSAKKKLNNVNGDYDGYVVIATKGANRGSDRYDISFSNFIRKTPGNFTLVSVGFTKDKEVVAVFNDPGYTSTNMSIAAKVGVVSNKAKVMQLFGTLGYPIPTGPDQSHQIHFKMKHLIGGIYKMEFIEEVKPIERPELFPNDGLPGSGSF
jgi:hypothetical protein